MRNLVQNEWHKRAIFAVIIFMLGSLFISRAMLSIGVITFIALTTLHAGFLQQLRNWANSTFLLSLSFLFFIPFVSGLWSADVNECAEVMIVKLPLILFPIAFAGKWQLRDKEYRWIAACFLLFTVFACCWSLVQYLLNIEAINQSYLRAKTIPTLMGDDHVRFSWIVFLGIWISVFLLPNAKRIERLILFSVAVFLIIYLHLLAARAGLIMLYLFSLCYIISKIKAKPRQALLVTAGLSSLLIIGWLCFPTFRNRIRYNLYDLSLIISEKYQSGTSDGNRMVSLKAGWALLKENPISGVGAGDVWHEVGRWYDDNVNGIQESDKLYPSNEWLAHGCMAGWPGIILFSFAILLPLGIKRMRQRFFWISFHLTAICLFLVETSLEIQYGIFIYTFFALWWWKWHCFEADNREIAEVRQ